MTNTAPLPDCSSADPPRPLRLLEQLRWAIRTRHYSRRTEEAYAHWVVRYVRFHGRRHPRELGAEHVTAFLSSLANDRNVAASTQNQALAALLFLYKAVLALELPWMSEIVRARRPRRLPVVLARAEVHALLDGLEGVHALMAKLMYGTGMRLMECLCLRVKDVDLVRGEVIVRQGKGAKDRLTMFPSTLVEAGYDFRTVQDLLGHKDVSTTMIYTHVLNRGGRGVVSPLDR